MLFQPFFSRNLKKQKIWPLSSEMSNFTTKTFCFFAIKTCFIWHEFISSVLTSEVYIVNHKNALRGKLGNPL